MSADRPPAPNAMSLPRKWIAGLAIALLLGIGFRLIWPDDIEYKLDEYYTYSRVKQFVDGTGGAQPGDITRWLGMQTSKGFRNTGMSLWIFNAIGLVSGAGSPPSLARGVQACNVAAILLALVFAVRCLRDREREWWLWAIAMVCLNPFAVLFERKIWPPCTLPLLMVLFLFGWRLRSKRWGAFCWGLVGILAGQIHMAGFFYAASFFLWTAAYDRRRTAWRWWFAGNVLGVIPMLPWIYYMANASAHTGESGGAPFVAWWRPFSNHFWVDWISEPFGLGLEYSLGGDFQTFASHPWIGGHATYGVAGLLALAAGLGIWLLAGALIRFSKNRAEWLANWNKDHAAFTPSALQAGFLFFGILLTISLIRFERHYLIVAFPLLFLWVAWLALPPSATERQWAAGRRLLLALCVVNALITFAFLDFIHNNGGAPNGDYGKSYVKQLQDRSPFDYATMKAD